MNSVDLFINDKQFFLKCYAQNEAVKLYTCILKNVPHNTAL